MERASEMSEDELFDLLARADNQNRRENSKIFLFLLFLRCENWLGFDKKELSQGKLMVWVKHDHLKHGYRNFAVVCGSFI